MRGAAEWTPSERDRLLMSFADLASFGVAARPAAPGPDPRSTRAALRRAVRQDYPDALGTCVFWTDDDDRGCFDAGGALRRDLPLHHSGEEAARVAAARLSRAGFEVVDGPGSLCLMVCAGRSSGRSRRPHAATSA